MYLLLTFLLLGLLSTAAHAQFCSGVGSVNCGGFCCPSTGDQFDAFGALRTQCCNRAISNRAGCCSPSENLGRNSEEQICASIDQGIIQQIGVTTCNGVRCPDSCDNNKRLRDQCCQYFRGGCCSPEENDDNETLFLVTIGLSIGTVILVIILILIFVSCCCCGLCGDCLNCCFRQTDLRYDPNLYG